MLQIVLVGFGCLVLLGIIVKGFWVADRVKPIEQPDNWSNHSPGAP